MINKRNRTKTRLLAITAAAAMVAAACGSDGGESEPAESAAPATDAASDAEPEASDAPPATEAPEDEEILVGLILKDTSSFFLAMAEGAEQAAEAQGVTLQQFAGDNLGDNDSQVEAIENLVASGAVGILIAPTDSVGIVPAIEAAQEAGVVVITLDTPTDPTDAADVTYSTDNFQAGELIGQYSAAVLGDAAADARIGMLNFSADQISVDVLRDQGFLAGFGIELNDPDRFGDEDDPRIVGNELTGANEEGGRTGMENLLQLEPAINVVYTINEPTAAGAYEALNAAGIADDDVLLLSVDGGCAGVADVADGRIDATSMQFPLRMAENGVNAVVDFARNGTALPEPSEGLEFFNTGVMLVTDNPVDGIESITTDEALEICWG